MKTSLKLLVLLFLLSSAISCSQDYIEKTEYGAKIVEYGRFEIIDEGYTFFNRSHYDDNHYQILLDKETGVKYLWVTSGYKAGLTLLVE